MSTKTLACREHGGKFTVVAKRGRPPVKCTPDNTCTAVKGQHIIPDVTDGRSTRGSRKTHTSVATPAKARVSVPQQRTLAKPQMTPAEAETLRKIVPSQRALAPAIKAKAMLSELGWTVEGKAWVKDGESYSSVTASRGSELYYAVWQEGVAISEDYSLWNVEQPQKNELPFRPDLPFDPNEIPDSALAQMLAGTRVTWFNRLAQKTETAIVHRDTIQIEHSYNGYGDEHPGARIVKFIDTVGGTGYRAFRLDALVQVG